MKIKKSETPLTKVSRTKIIEGKSIPAFIHNQNYFYVDLDIYEDGIIWCWDSTDLDLFKQKLQTSWVKTSIPNGKSISIHGLGSWEIDNGNWLFDKDGFYEYVLEIIKAMNPQMQNLYQVFEKKINGVTIGEYSAGNVYRENKRFEHDIFPEKIKGDGFHLFYKNNDEYFLVRLSVFADEKIEINNLSENIELDLKSVKELVENEFLLTEIPQNAEVKIVGLGSFTAVKTNYVTSVEDKVFEIQDLIETLNNRLTSIEICSSIYDAYLQNPTLELKEKIKIAYENIPKHQRRYVGDMDVKDTAVRMIIYGEKEIENWSHYAAAKSLGEELPTITVPKPKDE
ncbi:MAG: hypothetical protein ABJA66_01600 [Actinomycetota bacterium]